MKDILRWAKMLFFAFAAIFTGAVVSAIPPFPHWFEMVDANQTPWLVVTIGSAVLGFLLMMSGILTLLMDQDSALSHDEAQDVEHSVRLAARPAAWRTTSYRVWGKAAGREGSEEFSFRDMKQAWQSGAWLRDPLWQRRFTTAIGALLLTIGIFGIVFTVGLPPIKAIVGAALFYACVMLVRGFWRA